MPRSKTHQRNPGRAARAAGTATRASKASTATKGSSATNVATAPSGSTETRVVDIDRDLEQWRAQAIPNVHTPLEADDVARLVRSVLALAGVADAGESFSVNTVHYYRRKDIIDAPDGRTVAARYHVRHIWQAAGARLAGYLGLVTLAEARRIIRGADAAVARRFLAARIADARARAATRRPPPDGRSLTPEVRSLTPHTLPPETLDARPLAVSKLHSAPQQSNAMTSTVIPLGGNALCLIPSGHAALRSPSAARTLVAALARELGLES